MDPATAMMLMPKKNRIAIYELLFKEGVMVAKDVHMPKPPAGRQEGAHPSCHEGHAVSEISQGYVKEQFAWRHFYWYLTNEGNQYLRDYLHLPPEIVPATLGLSHPETGRSWPEGECPARFTMGRRTDTYRRNTVPPAPWCSTEFQFRGGFGRGLGQPPQ